MTVRLRAHHLLCILTYIGRGYTPAFTANYDAIVARLRAGEGVELVEGPDDICQPLLEHDQAHCNNESVTWRDAQARAAVAPLLGRLDRRITLSAFDLQRLRAAFAAGTTRTACQGCEWSGLCDGVAGAGFAGVRLC